MADGELFLLVHPTFPLGFVDIDRVSMPELGASRHWPFSSSHRRTSRLLTSRWIFACSTTLRGT